MPPDRYEISFPVQWSLKMIGFIGGGSTHIPGSRTAIRCRITISTRVVRCIPGRVIDERYTRMLIERRI